MHLTRTKSIVLAVGIIVIFFAVGLIFLNLNQKTIIVASTNLTSPTSVPAPATTSSSQSSSSDAQSLFKMNTFHRSEVKNGRTVWEIDGTQGQYFPETNTAKIQNARLKLYGKNNQTTELTTKEAELLLSGPALDKAHAYLGVTIVHNGDTTLNTDEATYDKIKGTVSTAGPVKIVGKSVDLTADKLDGKTEEQIFVFSGNVLTVIKPTEKQASK